MRKDRPPHLRKGGGLLICVRHSVVYSEIDIRLEISGVKIGGVSIFNAYNLPSNSFAIEAFDFLSAFSNIVLCRDFNSHHDVWGSNLSNSYGRNLVVIERSIPTHFCLTGHASWNVLDLTIVSNSLASHSSSTITNDLLGSDHTVIFTQIRGCSAESAFVHPSWNFTNANWPLFSEMCDSALTAFSANLTILLPTFWYKYFTCSLIPKTKPWRKSSVPWWTKTAT